MRIYMQFATACLIATMLAVLGGCASNGDSSTREASSAAHAECCVCKYNNDLACVDVTVTDTTPRAVYQGKTYYFCSDDCRKDFQNRPDKWARR